jgi:hypothetical protein
MTSHKEIDANRRNALKGTGPTTADGKRRSRCNAVRHGLTAETVIGALEDADDYRAFEAAISTDYDAQSAIERELVLRLASLLWRLRRALAMETGLLEIQATELMKVNEPRSESRQMVYAIFDQSKYGNGERDLSSSIETSEPEIAPWRERTVPESSTDADLARCFLRLAPSFPLDRLSLSRYETRLWRQVAQTLVALDQLDSRKPLERNSRLRNGRNLLMTSF